MITASWPRLVVGTILLFIGAGFGAMAWALETCAGGNADSLWTGGVTLVANVLAWTLLGSRVPSKLVLFVAVLPAIAALSYTYATAQLTIGNLTEGLSACQYITGEEGVGRDGDEFWFIVLWLLASASFWVGLIPVVIRALRVHTPILDNE